MVALSKKFPLTFIVGPTASGKSDLAIAAAKKFQGAVVNFDSLQFFTDLNIGTAKPTKAEMNSCPHHLFNVCAMNEEFTAGRFRKKATQLIEKEGALTPLFFVGGSGFYLQALEKGMYEVNDIPEKIVASVKNELEELGLEKLYEELVTRDRIHAEKISPNDQYRIIRAVTMMRAENKTVSQIVAEHKTQQEKSKIAEEIIKIGIKIDRKILRERVALRTEAMLKAGLVKEVQLLLERAEDGWAPLACVGYKEVVAYLKQQISKDEMEQKIITNTMRLAKKQMTWFKRDVDIQWFEASENIENVLEFLSKKEALTNRALL